MPNRMNIHLYGMRLAETASTRSEDPYNQVGVAVLREDKTVAGLGYNGAPPGVELEWDDRDRRREFVLHAEVNALRYLRPDEGAVLYATMMPCKWCMRVIASYRIPVVYYRDALDPSIYDVETTREIARVSGIKMFDIAEVEA